MLSIPPTIGLGTLVDLAILIAGIVAFAIIAVKGNSPPAYTHTGQSDEIEAQPPQSPDASLKQEGGVELDEDANETDGLGTPSAEPPLPMPSLKGQPDAAKAETQPSETIRGQGFCAKCGNALEPNYILCPNCGTKR